MLHAHACMVNCCQHVCHNSNLHTVRDKGDLRRLNSLALMFTHVRVDIMSPIMEYHSEVTVDYESLYHKLED